MSAEIEAEGRLIEQLMKGALKRKMEAIGRHALPAVSAGGGRATYDRLLQAIGDAPVVMVLCLAAHKLVLMMLTMAMACRGVCRRSERPRTARLTSTASGLSSRAA
jgi:uncharacterized membrane protein YeiH